MSVQHLEVDLSRPVGAVPKMSEHLSDSVYATLDNEATHKRKKKRKKASAALLISNTCSFFLRVFEPSYQYSNDSLQKRFYQSSQFRKLVK